MLTILKLSAPVSSLYCAKNTKTGATQAVQGQILQNIIIKKVLNIKENNILTLKNISDDLAANYYCENTTKQQMERRV